MTNDIVLDPSVIVAAYREWASISGNTQTAGFTVPDYQMPDRKIPALSILHQASRPSLEKESPNLILTVQCLNEALIRMEEEQVPDSVVDSVEEWIMTNLRTISVESTGQSAHLENKDLPVVQAIDAIQPAVVISTRRIPGTCPWLTPAEVVAESRK